MAKAKKATKKRPVAKRAAKTSARARTRPAKRKTVRKTVSKRATSVAKAGGPSIPLRDLIRGGMPRSSKARGGISGSGAPQARGRMNAGNGLKAASGTSMMQYQPGPLEHVGTQRAPIRKG